MQMATLPLNDGCLENIFEKLELWDRINFAQASTLFWEFSKNYCKVKKISQTLEMNIFSGKSAVEVEKFFQLLGPNVHSISGRLLDLRNNNILASILQYCPNLESISLRHVEMYENEHYVSKYSREYFIGEGYAESWTNLLHLLAQSENIKTLVLPFCVLNDENILQLPEMPKLEMLLLSRNMEITGKHLSRFPSVKTLHIYGCNILEFIPPLENLEILNISQCRKISNVALINIFKACKKLQRLYCADNPNLDDECLRFCGDLKHLAELHIGNCQAITNVGLLALLQNAKSLTLVNVERCRNITNDFVFEAVKILEKDEAAERKQPVVFKVQNTGISKEILKDARYLATEALLKLMF